MSFSHGSPKWIKWRPVIVHSQAEHRVGLIPRNQTHRNLAIKMNQHQLINFAACAPLFEGDDVSTPQRPHNATQSSTGGVALRDPSLCLPELSNADLASSKYVRSTTTTKKSNPVACLIQIPLPRRKSMDAVCLSRGSMIVAPNRIRHILVFRLLKRPQKAFIK
ncbi:hypothetical protein BJY00DRAFT_258615 [Aspergillus carlsbadensis]|nr:hypothetical protein BJY00DRAFT_258615 [Aspergillus carlsbadensis]